jgi:predicted anti-sigma-YlaC factor YlaD
MECSEVQELLIDFYEGEIPDKRQAIQEHLDRCTVCAREYQRLVDDMARLKARREDLARENGEWVSFLPGVRRKISMREARRQSLVPVKRLVPILVLMVVIVFVYNLRVPVSEEQESEEAMLLGQAGTGWVTVDDLEMLVQLEVDTDDLYANLVGEDDAAVLQRLEGWENSNPDIIEQLMELSGDEREEVFTKLEKGFM